MPRKRQWMKRLPRQSLENKGNVTVLGLHVDHRALEGHLNVQEAGAIIVKKIAMVPVLTVS